jgi:hypothetical protein
MVLSTDIFVMVASRKVGIEQVAAVTAITPPPHASQRDQCLEEPPLVTPYPCR